MTTRPQKTTVAPTRQKQLDPPELLTLSRMARRLRVTVRWLRAEAEAGRVPCVMAERQMLFNSEAVERVLLQRAEQQESQP